MYFRTNIYIHTIAQSAGAIEYTDCISAERQDPLPTIVEDMTPNNLMMKLQ